MWRREEKTRGRAKKPGKEAGNDRGATERARGRNAIAIFSARVVKQQKIINHRDFYSAEPAEINLIT